MCSKWSRFEEAKQELARRNLPPEEYQREIRKLCNKFKI
jgi:hypothetical protein